MKKKLLLLLMAFAALNQARAKDIAEEGLWYQTVNDSQCILKGVVPGFSGGMIVVPSMVTYMPDDGPEETYFVAGIGDGAFDRVNTNIPDINGVMLPATLMTIGERAFAGTSIQYLYIPSGIVSIGNEAFKGCNNLQEIRVPSGGDRYSGLEAPTFGKDVFADCSSLTQATLPNFVGSIGEGMFKNCNSLQNFTREGGYSNVQDVSIGDYAFYGCSSLYTVELAAECKIIGAHAFENCTGLSDWDYTGFYVPETVETIGDYAFANSNVKHVGASDDREGLLPELLSLGEGAFMNCTNLEKFIFSDVITTIGKYAFKGCENLEKFGALPVSLTTIGDEAFAECRWDIKPTFIIPKNVKTVGKDIFKNSSYLTKCAYPSTIKNPFPDGIIAVPYNPATAIIEDDLVIYDDNRKTVLFVGMSAARVASGEYPQPPTVNLSGVTKIGECSFSRTMMVNFNGNLSSVTNLGKKAFYECYSSSIDDILTFSSSLTAIPDSAFYNAYISCDITIPASVKTIGTAAFKNDSYSNITSFKMSGTNMTSIGAWAFAGNAQITSISLPSSVKTIGASAFEDCSALKSISLGSSLTEIGDNAFSDCSSLGSVTLPSTLTKLGAGVFSGCSALSTAFDFTTFKSLTMTTVPTYLFNRCSSIKSVVLPNNVTAIASYAFANCYSLTTVNLPSTLTRIGNSAFEGCTAITGIDIPSGVTEIGNKAFKNSKINFTIPEGIVTIGDEAFAENRNITTLKAGSNLTNIGASAFSGCTALASVEFSSSNVTIGSNAFYGCTALATLNLGDKIKSIGSKAFWGCSKIKELFLPPSVVTVGSQAFSQCNSLIKAGYPDNVSPAFTSSSTVKVPYSATGASIVDLSLIPL